MIFVLAFNPDTTILQVKKHITQKYFIVVSIIPFSFSKETLTLLQLRLKQARESSARPPNKVSFSIHMELSFILKNICLNFFVNHHRSLTSSLGSEQDTTKKE